MKKSTLFFCVAFFVAIIFNAETSYAKLQFPDSRIEGICEYKAAYAADIQAARVEYQLPEIQSNLRALVASKIISEDNYKYNVISQIAPYVYANYTFEVSPDHVEDDFYDKCTDHFDSQISRLEA